MRTDLLLISNNIHINFHSTISNMCDEHIINKINDTLAVDTFVNDATNIVFSTTKTQHEAEYTQLDGCIIAIRTTWQL